MCWIPEEGGGGGGGTGRAGGGCGLMFNSPGITAPNLKQRSSLVNEYASLRRC